MALITGWLLCRNRMMLDDRDPHWAWLPGHNALQTLPSAQHAHPGGSRCNSAKPAQELTLPPHPQVHQRPTSTHPRPCAYQGNTLRMAALAPLTIPLQVIAVETTRLVGSTPAATRGLPYTPPHTTAACQRRQCTDSALTRNGRRRWCGFLRSPTLPPLHAHDGN
jgi:hypothetical protein